MHHLPQRLLARILPFFERDDFSSRSGSDFEEVVLERGSEGEAAGEVHASEDDLERVDGRRMSVRRLSEIEKENQRTFLSLSSLKYFGSIKGFSKASPLVMLTVPVEYGLRTTGARVKKSLVAAVEGGGGIAWLREAKEEREAVERVFGE
jgi:hypothetical protein